MRAAKAAPLAVLLAAGLAIALAAAGTHGFLVPIEHRGIRGWIDGPLGPLGFAEGKGMFAAEVAAMGLAYLAALLVADRLDGRTLGAVIVALLAIFTLAPPLLSTDVFSYMAYARLGAVHGLDPYVVAPNAAPHDVIYHFVHWGATRSAYGPLFTVATYPLALAGPTVTLWALKLAAGLAGLGCVALVARIAARLGHSPKFAAAAFGLNPVMLVWAVGGAHNDLLMLVAMLGGIALVLERRHALGGAALVAALAIKVTAGVALPFAVVAARPRGRLLAGIAAALAVIAVVSYVSFGVHALNLIGILRREHRFISTEAVPREVLRLFGVHIEGIVPALLSATLAAVLAWLAVRVYKGMSWIGATGWGFVALVALSTWFTPWYTIWPLPLAAVTRDRRLMAATLMLQVDIVVNDLALFVH